MTNVIEFWIAYVAAPLLLWFVACWIGRRPSVTTTDVDATLCGRCGYDVRGLPTNVCPECGSNLDQVGRLTPKRLRRSRWMRRLVPIAWLGLILIAWLFLTAAALFSFGPRRQVGRNFDPLVAFAGNQEQPWPFMIISDEHWDRDESPRAFAHWYPQLQRECRLSSAGRSPTLTPTVNVHADADQGLTWDAAHDRWSYESPGNPTDSGKGFPPIEQLRRWATDVAARRPPARPLTTNELGGLVLAGGDILIACSPRAVGTQWPADRADLIAGGATPLIMAQVGGTFDNSVRPFWPPAAAVTCEWFVMAVLSWRALQIQKSRARSVLAQ